MREVAYLSLIFTDNFNPTSQKLINRIRCQQNSGLYFVLAAPWMVQESRYWYFFVCFFFSFDIFSSSYFPILIFPFMHFSSYPFRSFRLSVLHSLSAFVRCIPLFKYPQTRLASVQLRAGSVTLGSELRLGSRLGTRSWLITDEFGAH